MAIAVIGGVISSTLLSLVVVPSFYLAIENAKGRIARWFPKKTGAAHAVPDASVPSGGE
jgi:HAE1 family hydrophobic/amphiphilic exporter-1